MREEGTMGIGRSLARAVGVAVVLIGGIAFAGPKEISGNYTVDGKNADGSNYTGTATIEGTDGGNCAITWIIGSNQASHAFCMRQDDVLGAAYQLGDSIGLVIYRIKDSGVLEGTWTVAGKEGVFEEKLTPKK